MRGRLAGEAGYSLLEMITVLAILTTVVTGITTLFISGTRADVDMNKRFQVQNDARGGADRLRRDLRCASSLSSSTASAITVVTPCNALGYKWCTVLASAGRYSLHRVVGSGACSSTSPKYADYLTTGNVFTAQAASSTTLARLKASLPVKMPTMTATYTLCTIVTMRNSMRSGAAVTALTCP
jgi:type II secretory pathway pseudopilin PulG